MMPDEPQEEDKPSDSPTQLVRQLEEDSAISQPEVQSEWDETYSNPEPVLLSDYEHKAHLIRPDHVKIKKMQDILDKDFALSILDSDETFIYKLKGTCAIDWVMLGYENLADQRKEHLKMALHLKRSTAGIERFLQTGIANVTTEMDMLSNKMTPEQAVEKKTGASIGGLRKWFS
jgi:hypothetical protein